MTTFYQSFDIQTVSGRPSYHDLNGKLNIIAEKSNIDNGIMVIQTPHTTCSFYYDETMHDCNYYGDEYLQVDINNIMDRLVPRMTSENQYCSPGPKHIEFGMSLSDPRYPAEKWVMLNTDAHLRSSIYGSNFMTIILHEGKLELGSLGRVYFVDWDQLRARKRTVSVMIMGDEKK
ncbi:YjbQ family protein [Absicoccus porci]|uniref:YjbQ family protein n=1 Tax=Absicoccus porci TaxID=2486576 RepID=UPI002942509C|nr:YjbQ family protein [Absicoccus porci]